MEILFWISFYISGFILSYSFLKGTYNEVYKVKKVTSIPPTKDLIQISFLSWFTFLLFVVIFWEDRKYFRFTL